MTQYIYNNREHRLAKAKVIQAVLSDFVNFAESSGLEVGTGAGIMSSFFAKNAMSISSADVVDERIETDGYIFEKLKDANLPYESGTFDFSISNQVIEHIADQELHVKEIFRVTKSGGAVYLATPNRYWPIEVHSRLIFLGALPRKFSMRYYKILRKKTWNVYPLSYFGVKALMRPYAKKIYNYAPKIILSHEDYNYPLKKKWELMLKNVPAPTIELLSSLMPSFIFVGIKK